MNKGKVFAIAAVLGLGIFCAMQGVGASEADTEPKESEVDSVSMVSESDTTQEIAEEAQIEAVETEAVSEAPEDASRDDLDELIIDEMEEEVQDIPVPCETEIEMLSDKTEELAPLVFNDESGSRDGAQLFMPQMADLDPCDLNQSGKVDINDVQFLFEELSRYRSGEITQEEACAYDLDGDQELTDADITCLLERL